MIIPTAITLETGLVLRLLNYWFYLLHTISNLKGNDGWSLAYGGSNKEFFFKHGLSDLIICWLFLPCHFKPIQVMTAFWTGLFVTAQDWDFKNYPCLINLIFVQQSLSTVHTVSVFPGVFPAAAARCIIYSDLSILFFFKVLILLYGNKPKLIIQILTSKCNSLSYCYKNTWKEGRKAKCWVVTFR